MFYYILKLIISASLIVAISEITKRSSLIGSILASVPLVSVLAIIWIYLDTKDIDLISDFSKSIFWLVLPSLVFFIVFPIMLNYKFNFYLSLILSLSVMIICYFIMIKILPLLNINV